MAGGPDSNKGPKFCLYNSRQSSYNYHIEKYIIYISMQQTFKYIVSRLYKFIDGLYILNLTFYLVCVNIEYKIKINPAVWILCLVMNPIKELKNHYKGYKC